MEKTYCPKCDKEIETFSNKFYSTYIDVTFSCKKCSIFIVMLKEFDDKTICSKKLYFKCDNLNYYAIGTSSKKCYNVMLLNNIFINIDREDIITEKDAWKYLERYIENALFI